MQNYLLDPAICYYPYAIEKHLKMTKKGDLDSIAKDHNQAKEMIYLFCSNLVSTQVEFRKGNGHQTKKLHSYILIDQLGNKYKSVKKYLIENNLIGSDNRYEVGVHSITYWLSEEVVKSKTKELVLKNPTILNRRNKINNSLNELIEQNPITRISIDKVFPHLNLPTEEQVTQHLELKAKAGYTTKKGKELKILGNKKRQTSIEGCEVIYTCDLIAIYKNLTKDGLKIYSVGNENCPRPVTSITLMPSIIRELITLDNKELVELDFGALHPNIANHLYGNNTNSISHKDLADFLKIDLKKAKRLNLSYFNYQEKHFLNARASRYYKQHHPMLYSNLWKIKKKDPKIITYEMFDKEVELMSKVITELDRNNIRPNYVYDAIYVIEDDKEDAKDIMNSVAMNMGIHSTVK